MIVKTGVYMDKMNKYKEYKDVLYKLITHISGEKKFKTAVVIPSATSVELLSQHLKLLDMLGSSGGFGIGQILAYTLGYDYVINADVDCFPVSDNLIYQLISVCKTSNKAVIPLCISKISGKFIKRGHNPNQYGTVPKSVFDKCGFEYMHFFRGGEDSEFLERLRAMNLIIEEKNVMVSHPFLANCIIEHINEKNTKHKYFYYERANFSKFMLCLYFSITNLKIKKSIWNFYHLFLYFCYRFIFSFLRCKGMLKTIFDGWMIKFDEKYDDSIMCSIPEIKKTDNLKATTLDIGNKKSDKNIIFFKQFDWSGKKGTLVYLLEIINKIIILYLNNGDYIIPTNKFYNNYSMIYPYLLLIKPLYYKGKIYSWKTPLGNIIFAGAIMVLLLPIMFLLLLLSQIKIGLSDLFPPRPNNLRKNLIKFYLFVKK